MSVAWRRALVLAQDLVWFGAVCALVHASGSAASPLWALSLLMAIAGTVPAAQQRAAFLLVIAVPHVVLMFAFGSAGQPADAVFVGLAGITSTLARTVSVRAAVEEVRTLAERTVTRRRSEALLLERERFRVARELHDGVGAELTALTLQLRQLAAGSDGEVIESLVGRTRSAMDGLRIVVATLRNGGANLGELGKLVDATCRGSCGAATYERESSRDEALTPVAPDVALAVLHAAHDLVRSAAADAGVTRIRVRLTAGRSLDLVVESDAPRLPEEHVGRRSARFPLGARAP